MVVIHGMHYTNWPEGIDQLVDYRHLFKVRPHSIYFSRWLGVTWDEIASGPALFGSGATHFFMLDTLSGWVGTNRGGIFKTVDGGITWDSIGHIGDRPIQKMVFTDENNGFIIDDLLIYQTSNGGISWGKREYNRRRDDYL